MVLGFIGLLVASVIISGLITTALGLSDDGMRYDCINEKWVFVPSRYDIMLEMLIRSR